MVGVPGQGTLCGHVLPPESGHYSVIDVCCGFMKNPHPTSLFPASTTPTTMD